MTFTASGDLLADIPAYCESENLIGSLANISALLMAELTDVNWVGFYLRSGQELRLGPFQGKPACTRIAWNRGVCGTAAATKSPQLVKDVEAFPGHIACDSASRSEIVVPLIVADQVVAVLDVDSPRLARFNEDDLEFFKKVAAVLVRSLNWSQYLERQNV